MATDRPRYTVSVDNELFQQIEDFRFERRFQTRSEATVELIRLGLESLKKEQQTPREKPADEARDDGPSAGGSGRGDTRENGSAHPRPILSEITETVLIPAHLRGRRESTKKDGCRVGSRLGDFGRWIRKWRSVEFLQIGIYIRPGAGEGAGGLHLQGH